MYYLLFFVVVLQFLVLLSFYRNNWVYSVRDKLLVNDIEEFKKLVSYNQMYWKVWIWDINKFKKEDL